MAHDHVQPGVASTPEPMNDSETVFGLLATARYAPRLRLERSEVFAQHRWMAPGLKSLAKGRRAIANWDEDAVTMAVEAARSLLAATPARGTTELTLVSTTLPFADRLNAGIVAAALGLDTNAIVRDVASSSRAALTELVAALRHPACKAQDTQTALSFADRAARVLSHTSDFLAYTPAPPFQFGHIDFEGGGRVLMEFADTDRDELSVGLPVRMVYRIKDLDAARGFRRYFWKATPVRGATA